MKAMRYLAVLGLLCLGSISSVQALPPAGPERVLSPNHASFAELILACGPGKDGIPAIDSPSFSDATAADGFLKPQDIVFGVYHQGEAKAYPQRIMVWHEIVNDSLGGEPVSITYCPLTATAIGFKRGNTSLGVSGQLLNSNVVMYDRASDSYWSQIAAGISRTMVSWSMPSGKLAWNQPRAPSFKSSPIATSTGEAATAMAAITAKAHAAGRRCLSVASCPRPIRNSMGIS